MFRVASLILLLLVGGAAVVFALEVHYPADGTYVTRSDALVIKAGKGIDGLVLELGGEKSDLIDISGQEYRTLFEDMLILQPSYDPGRNRVRVTGYFEGEKVAETEVNFYYQTERTSAPPEGYRRYLMHTAEQEAACVACHNLSPEQADLDLPSAQKNPCVGCHRGMLRPEWVHGPAGAFECGTCHALQTEQGRFRERNIHAPLCTECHQDIVDGYLGRPYVHGPVAVGLCNVCHDSHASPHQGQLVASVNELCLGCHENISKGTHVGRGIGGRSHPLSGVDDPSRAGELYCTGCHNPHGGDSPYYYQRGAKTRMELCQVCHRK